MFLKLPRDIQLRIYENHLKIGDRFRLNSVLSPTEQFHENHDRDCKIVLLKYGFTHNILTKDLSSELAKFIYDNKNDPTIREIIIENNIVITKYKNENDNNNLFINWLLLDQDSPIRGLVNIYSIDEIRAIFRIISQYCNSKKFDLLMKNELFLSYFNIIEIDSFIFSILNMDNFDLLQFCKQRYYDFFQSGFEYLNNPIILRLFVQRKNTIKFYLENIYTSDNLKSVLIAECVNKMNVELFQYLIS